MGRKVILDVDPGIDDAMPCAWRFRTRVGGGGGNGRWGERGAGQATRNVRRSSNNSIRRAGRLGAASEPDNRLAVDRRSLYGSDGLGGTSFVVAERQHLLPSEKVICDQVRDAPHLVTIVALGP